MGPRDRVAAWVALLGMVCFSCKPTDARKGGSRLEPVGGQPATPSATAASAGRPSLDQPAQGSRGCGRDSPTGDITVNVQDGNGVRREVNLLVPTPYDPNFPRAISISYHGAGGRASHAKGFRLQEAPGASAAAIFVFPQGVPYKNFGVGWDDTCAGYDMPLFDNMLAHLDANYCIDTSRVFVSGFSWGCDHVTALACCRGSRIRGVAAASCSDEYGDKADHTTYQNLPCPQPQRAGIRFTHASVEDSGYPSPLFATTVSLYRAFNGCSDGTMAVDPNPCRSFEGCNSPFIDCPYPNLAHQLPPNFADESWAFFMGL
jgi:polyhydroxybutyrate depolymerase